LRFRPEIAGVRDPGAAQVLFGLGGDVPRITRVLLARDRVLDRTLERQRGVLRERIHARRGGIRDEQHVALVDRLKAADRGAVEPEAFLEALWFQTAERDGRVLPFAGQVDEL